MILSLKVHDNGCGRAVWNFTHMQFGETKNRFIRLKLARVGGFFKLPIWSGQFLLLLLLALRGYGSTGFQVNGELQYRCLQENGSISDSLKETFTVTVHDSSWMIHVVRDGDTNCDYYEASYDGTNIYQITNFEKTWKRWKAEAPTQYLAPQLGAGTIQDSCIPHFFDTPEMSIIWFAYASHSCMEKREDKTTCEPISLFGVNADAFNYLLTGRYQQKFQMATDDAGFPKYAVWHDDGLIYDHNGRTTPRISPFDAVFTNSIFQVLDQMQTNGFALPGHFILLTYRPMVDGKSIADIIPSYQYEGHITDVRALSAASHDDFIPKLPGVVGILDTRFIKGDLGINNIGYDVSNHWLTIGEVRQLPQYKKAAGRTRGISDRMPLSGRILVLFCMTALTIGFLTLSLTRRGAGKQQLDAP